MTTRIEIGREPARYDSAATFFDGNAPLPVPARLSIDEEAEMLVIAPEGRAPQRWPLSEIRRVPDQAGGDLLVVRLRGDPVARLIVEDHVLIARCPHIDRRPPVQNRWKLAGWAVAAVASVALIITVLVPAMADQLARYIPPEGERALGETTLTQIREAMDETGMDPIATCEAPAGRAALDRMTARFHAVMPADQPLTVLVLDHPMINAFALPGGYVVFFRGLIDTAETPEEVAAVLAHEIGHVVSRDPTRHALRSAGSIGVLGLLFGDFAGGTVVLFLAERLIEAQYSQQAEIDADAFAYDALTRADLPPAALATMFERLREEGGEPPAILSHFMSHPELTERITAAERASPEGLETRPVLDDAEWAALQAICD